MKPANGNYLPPLLGDLTLNTLKIMCVCMHVGTNNPYFIRKMRITLCLYFFGEPNDMKIRNSAIYRVEQSSIDCPHIELFSKKPKLYRQNFYHLFCFENQWRKIAQAINHFMFAKFDLLFIFKKFVSFLQTKLPPSHDFH